MPQQSVRNWICDEFLFNKEDLILSKKITSYMRGYLDKEEVLNDPYYLETTAIAESMVTAFKIEKEHNKRNAAFVREAISVRLNHEDLTAEIHDIIDESESNKITEIAAGWVNEWQERDPKDKDENRSVSEIRDFVKSSAQLEGVHPGEGLPVIKKQSKYRTMIGLLTLSAAAVAGVLITLRILLPSDPDRLFNSNYEPLSVISPAVRGSDTGPADNYTSGLEKYKAGDYTGAATLFSAELKKDPSNTASIFFMGLTEEALGNYNQAVILLSEVSGQSSEFKKDAQWYLGLAYLKLHDRKQASSCFSPLAQSPGFYRDKAERILNRMK